MFAKNKVTQSMIDAVNSILNEDKKLLLEPEPENTTKDKKKDLKGEKETGMTHAQYEKSARDKKEDMKEGSFIHRLLTQVNEDKASAKNLETFTDNNMGENKKLVGNQSKLDVAEPKGKLDAKDFKMLRKQRTEEVDLEEDISNYSIEEIEEFMQTEDYEQLDELSKKTLKSYLDKSAGRSEKIRDKWWDANLDANVSGDKKDKQKEKHLLNKTTLVDKARAGAKARMIGTSNEEVEQIDEVQERGMLRDVAPRLSGLVPKHKLKPNVDKRKQSPAKKETNEEVELEEAKHYPYKFRATYHDPDTNEVTHYMDFTHRNLDAAKKHAEGSRLQRRDGKEDKLHSVVQMKESVQTTQDKNSGKISTDTLSGRVPGGKLNSFKNFKTNLTTSGKDSVPSEIEHGEDTKEKQKISTNPGPVDIKLDDKLTGPTPYTHFSDEKSITNEKVEPALREKRKEAEKENTKQIKTFASKVVESKNDKSTMSVMDRIKGVSKASFNKVKDTIGESSNEDVEMLDESAMLDQYLNSLGINPRTLTRDKKVSYAKSNAFITWKNNHQHLR